MNNEIDNQSIIYVFCPLFSVKCHPLFHPQKSFLISQRQFAPTLNLGGTSSLLTSIMIDFIEFGEEKCHTCLDLVARSGSGESRIEYVVSVRIFVSI